MEINTNINNLLKLQTIENNPIIESNKLINLYNKKWVEYKNIEKNINQLINQLKNYKINKNEKEIILNHLKLIDKNIKSQISNIIHSLLIIQKLLDKKIIASVMIKLLSNNMNSESNYINLAYKLLETTVKDIEKWDGLRTNSNLNRLIQLYFKNKSNTEIIIDSYKLLEICFDQNEDNNNNNNYNIENQEIIIQDNYINCYEISLEIQFENILNRLNSPLYKYHLLSLNSFIDNIEREIKIPLNDINQSITSFIDTILPILMYDCASIPFQLENRSKIQPTEKPISTLSGKTVKEIKLIISEFLEYYITTYLNNRIFSSNELIEKDQKLNENILKFSSITLSNLDLDDNLISNQFIEKVKEQFEYMTKVSSPREKLLCIKEFFNLLLQLLSESNSINNCGADLLLPCVIYCIIKSNVTLLNSNFHFIKIFRNSNLIEKETEYFLTTLDSAFYKIQCYSIFFVDYLFICFVISIVLAICLRPKIKTINNNNNNNKNIDYNNVIKLWPYPYQVSNGKNTLILSKDFSIESRNNSDILNNAIDRYTNLIFYQDSIILSSNYTLNNLEIVLLSDNEKLDFGFDESYSLEINDNDVINPNAVLTAETVYGAIRGLETFYQLVQYDYSELKYYISNCSWFINDKPRFPHRGVLIDTSRRFIPVTTIETILDTLAYNKFNTFHWHIVDSQAFPLTSKTYPNITKAAWSSREIYSYKDINNVIEYAKERGIRVLVELDMPGHAGSWGEVFDILPDGYNDSGTTCPWNCTTYCDLPIDPTNPRSIEVATGLLNEFTKVFNDSFFHLGGDEINYDCWKGSNKIKQWMVNQGIPTNNFDDLTIYFESIIYNKLINQFNKIPVVWEETFKIFTNNGLNNNSKLSNDVIIQVYHEPSLAQSTTKLGYRTILSPAQYYYLELPYSSWRRAYSLEPTNGIEKQNLNLILGGEGALWTDTIGVSQLFGKIYPTASAIAEKLWSPININDIDIAQYRLEYFHCSLIFRGINIDNVHEDSINYLKSCFNS